MRLPRTISASIQAIARHALGKDWHMYATLMNHWEEIVGQDYANVTTPVKITYPKGKKVDEQWAGAHRGGATLTVSLPQGLAMEFTMNSETMRSRINGFFGHEAVEKIALQPYYGAAPPTLRGGCEAEGTTWSGHRDSTLHTHEKISHNSGNNLAPDLSTIEDEELKQSLLNLAENIGNRKT